ncbi:unnamed protein product, partial [Meganyctiphanes norvegica]
MHTLAAGTDLILNAIMQHALKKSDSICGVSNLLLEIAEKIVLTPSLNRQTRVIVCGRTHSNNVSATSARFEAALRLQSVIVAERVFLRFEWNSEKMFVFLLPSPPPIRFCFAINKPCRRQAVFRGQESDTTERSYDSTASAYSARLCVQDTPHSQKGHREDLDLLVQFKGGLTLQAVLQVKYYKAGDSQHCEWGSTFHCLELDCETHTDAGLVAILKETFR